MNGDPELEALLDAEERSGPDGPRRVAQWRRVLARLDEAGPAPEPRPEFQRRLRVAVADAVDPPRPRPRRLLGAIAAGLAAATAVVLVVGVRNDPGPPPEASLALRTASEPQPRIGPGAPLQGGAPQAGTGRSSFEGAEAEASRGAQPEPARTQPERDPHVSRRKGGGMRSKARRTSRTKARSRRPRPPRDALAREAPRAGSPGFGSTGVLPGPLEGDRAAAGREGPSGRSDSEKRSDRRPAGGQARTAPMKVEAPPQLAENRRSADEAKAAADADALREPPAAPAEGGGSRLAAPRASPRAAAPEAAAEDAAPRPLRPEISRGLAQVAAWVRDGRYGPARSKLSTLYSAARSTAERAHLGLAWARWAEAQGETELAERWARRVVRWGVEPPATEAQRLLRRLAAKP